MPSWIQTTYGCDNPGCRHALDDRVFSAAEFQQFGGVCRTPDGLGCGQVLRIGETVNRLPRWIWRGALASSVTLASALALQRLFFPAPLQHIQFALAQSEVVDDAGAVDIEIVRSDDAEAAIAIDYLTIDGSARAGEDYVARRGRLVFAAGERSQRLSIEVLRDGTHQKPHRSFSVALSNVLGNPSHRVQVTARPVTTSEVQFMESSVLALSRVAKEIGDNVVRQGVLDQLLADSQNNPGEFTAYRRSLATVNGDLSRARERYVQDLRNLKAYQPAAVLDAMDRVTADLQQKGFAQQAQAAAITKRQFKEFLDQDKTDMDRWAQELSSVVPRTAGDDDTSI